MRTWIKGGIVGLVVWIVLILIMLSGTNASCSVEGSDCLGGVQSTAMWILLIIAFPVLFLGGSPVMSTFGPSGVLIFFIGTATMFVLWGILIGKIISKKK